ncbi:MAG: capsule biosynthesis protein, partial [Pseudorhodobacter sp.]
MTIKLKAQRFRTRRPQFPALPGPAEDTGLFDAPAEDGFGPGKFPTAEPANSAGPAGEMDMEAIRHEGLTGRQLRVARRMAQKHGLPATSDFDAVRLLRKAGIDPFQRMSILELVSTDDNDPVPPDASRALAPVPGGDAPRLPQTIKPAALPSTEVRAEQSHAADILHIQKDLARRRRRRSALLMARLFFFVLLPTLLTGWYYYVVATPLYSTQSEFVIQQSQAPNAAAGGLGGLLQGSPLATSQDSIAVQGYLQSREAMLRLDADHGFRAHFADPAMDPVQRLPPDAPLEQAYKTYKKNVQISYDPTEGIVKMEVIAADPAKAVEFASALIGYAEGQVDQLTQRLREDQMRGARDAFDEAEQK